MTSTGPTASPSRRMNRNSTSPTSAMRAATASASRKAGPRHVRGFKVVDGKKLTKTAASSPSSTQGSGRTARRHRGPAVDLGRRRHPLLHAGRGKARPDPGAGDGRQSHLRRFRKVAHVHLRHVVALRHRDGAHRRAMAVKKWARARDGHLCGGENGGGGAPGKGGTKRQLTFSRTCPARAMALTTVLVMIRRMLRGSALT